MEEQKGLSQYVLTLTISKRLIAWDDSIISANQVLEREITITKEDFRKIVFKMVTEGSEPCLKRFASSCSFAEASAGVQQ